MIENDIRNLYCVALLWGALFIIGATLLIIPEVINERRIGRQIFSNERQAG